VTPRVLTRTVCAKKLSPLVNIFLPVHCIHCHRAFEPSRPESNCPKKELLLTNPLISEIGHLVRITKSVSSWGRRMRRIAGIQESTPGLWMKIGSRAWSVVTRLLVGLQNPTFAIQILLLQPTAPAPALQHLPPLQHLAPTFLLRPTRSYEVEVIVLHDTQEKLDGL
jgi:hypothetical protein